MKLKEDDQVCVLEQGDSTKSGDGNESSFDKVMSVDGVVGYVRRKDLERSISRNTRPILKRSSILIF